MCITFAADAELVFFVARGVFPCDWGEFGVGEGSGGRGGVMEAEEDGVGDVVGFDGGCRGLWEDGSTNGFSLADEVGTCHGEREGADLEKARIASGGRGGANGLGGA